MSDNPAPATPAAEPLASLPPIRSALSAMAGQPPRETARLQILSALEAARQKNKMSFKELAALTGLSKEELTLLKDPTLGDFYVSDVIAVSGILGVCPQCLVPLISFTAEDKAYWHEAMEQENLGAINGPLMGKGNNPRQVMSVDEEIELYVRLKVLEEVCPELG